MKKIIIAITIIIILIFTYGEYKDYQRFHPKHANLKISETADLNYYNQETVYNYYQAIEEANSYMQMQWSANNIDVRSPENDDDETTLALAKYSKKIAKLNYYKGLLEQSTKLKSQDLTNAEIKNIVTEGISVKDYNLKLKAEKYKKMMLTSFKENNVYLGSKNAFVYEIQKLMVKKGYDIPTDGVFKNITSDAIMDFEAKNKLFSDGKLDELTLNLLLK